VGHGLSVRLAVLPSRAAISLLRDSAAVVHHRLEHGKRQPLLRLRQACRLLPEALHGKHDVNHPLTVGRGRPPPARRSRGSTRPNRPAARCPCAAVRGAGERAFRSRAALIRTRSASRAIRSDSASWSRAYGISRRPLLPPSASVTPMLGPSGPDRFSNSVASRVEMRPVSSISTVLSCRNRVEAHAPALSVAAAAGEAAPATPVRALFGLAHVELPALDVAAVQGRAGLLGLDVRGHFDEPEAARAPGVPVGDDRRGLTRPHLGKQRLQVRTRRFKGQIPYEQLLPHDLAPSSPPGELTNRVAVVRARSR